MQLKLILMDFQFNEFTFIYISQKQHKLIQINSIDFIFNTFPLSKKYLLHFTFFRKEGSVKVKSFPQILRVMNLYLVILLRKYTNLIQFDIIDVICSWFSQTRVLNIPWCFPFFLETKISSDLGRATNNG